MPVQAARALSSPRDLVCDVHPRVSHKMKEKTK